MYNTCVFTFFLILLFKYILSYDIPSDYRHSNLVPNTQTINSIKSNEIYIHQLNSSSKNFKFYFEAHEGQPLMYGYYAYDVSALSITPMDIPQYIADGFFFTPTKVDTVSQLLIKTTFSNDITSKSQYILIIYCASKENCEYCAGFQTETSEVMKLKENYPIADKGKSEGYYEDLIFNYSISLMNGDYKNDENLNITIYTSVYSGLLYYQNVIINEKEYNP